MTKKAGLILFLFFSALPLPLTFAETKAVTVNLQGEVFVLRQDQKIPATESLSLQEGDQIITEKGQVDVVCNDRWAYRMMAGAETSIDKLQVHYTRIGFAKGDALFHVVSISKEGKENVKESQFEISTPTAVAAVRGTQFWGRISPQSKSSAGAFAVQEGMLEVYLKSLEISFTLNSDQALDIPAGFEIPAMRSATEAEKNAMKKIDEIPLFIIKANLEKELALLTSLENLSHQTKNKTSTQKLPMTSTLTSTAISKSPSSNDSIKSGA